MASSVALDRWKHAQVFVGNSEEAYFLAGICQLEILKRCGARPHHNVLEIGCGALVAGRPLMQYLDPDRYVGIEPNTWLVEEARAYFPDMEDIFLTKRPVFLANLDFDASETGRKFDFVMSHSILSHAAHYQFIKFVEALSRDLSPHGVAAASLRMYDEHGTLMGDSMHEDWQYPGASYFAIETIKEIAEKNGLHAEHRPEFRDLFTRYVPSNIHDWIVFRRLAAGAAASRPDTLYGDPHYASTGRPDDPTPTDKPEARARTGVFASLKQTIRDTTAKS